MSSRKEGRSPHNQNDYVEEYKDRRHQRHKRSSREYERSRSGQRKHRSSRRSDSRDPHHHHHHKHKHRHHSRRGDKEYDRYDGRNKYDEDEEYYQRHKRYSRREDRDPRTQRNRTRSPHPLLSTKENTKFHAYLEQQNNQDREHAQQFWDGFQWVKKTETNPNAVPGSQFGISGDPSRNLKVHVTGLPTDLGISARDVREFFNKEILKNHPPEYKYSDQEEAYWRLSKEDRDLPRELLIELGKIPPDSLQQKDMPVVEVQLMPQLNAATIELKEARMSSWAKQLNGIKMLGQTLRVHGFADRIQFQNKTLAALAQQRGIQAVIGQENVMNTQTTAQATAFALAAVKGLQGNQVGINIDALGLTAATSVASKYLKVANLCERSPPLSKAQFTEIEEDMKEMFSMYPGLVSLTMIDQYDQKLGAQYGSAFIEYDNIDSAEKALKSMQGRTYDGRIVRAVYIPASLWNGELKIRAKKV